MAYSLFVSLDVATFDSGSNQLVSPMARTCLCRNSVAMTCPLPNGVLIRMPVIPSHSLRTIRTLRRKVRSRDANFPLATRFERTRKLRSKKSGPHLQLQTAPDAPWQRSQSHVPTRSSDGVRWQGLGPFFKGKIRAFPFIGPRTGRDADGPTEEASFSQSQKRTKRLPSCLPKGI